MKPVTWITLSLIIVLGLVATGGWFIYQTVTRTTVGLAMFGHGLSPSILTANLESTDSDVVMSSLSVLTDRKDPAGQTKAIQLLGSSDDYVWLNATLYLGALGDSQAVPHLIRSLKHRAWRAHSDAALYLEQITGERFGTDQKAWIVWWQAQHPESTFQFGFPEYEQAAKRLRTGSIILINGVLSPTTISHMGAPIELIGLRLNEGGDEQAAILALKQAVMSQMVELECDDGPILTSEGARRAFAYWTPNPMNNPELMNLARRGLGVVPFTQRTLLQAHLLQTGHYAVDADSVLDLTMKSALQTPISSTQGESP